MNNLVGVFRHSIGPKTVNSLRRAIGLSNVNHQTQRQSQRLSRRLVSEDAAISSEESTNGSEKNREDDKEIQKKYKEVMRAVPQPVVVVTTAEERSEDTWHKRGVTCSSFTSISLRPPVISFCMNKPSRMHDLLLRKQMFAVHVLGHNQVAYGMHFAKRADDKKDQFEEIPHDLSEEGLPIIRNTAAVLQCKVHSVLAVGDHFIWYGEVTKADSSPRKVDPLLYYARSFWSVGDEMFMKSFEQTTLPFEDWTHEAHLRMAYNYIKEHGKENAVPLIKNGIKRYNEQNKDKINRGYSETVTMFYITMIADAVQQHKNGLLTFDEFIQSHDYLSEKDLLFKYYSDDVIMSAKAKDSFVIPDKKSLPNS